MKKQENIENKVEQALNSLDGIQRAVANPYLYTRIRARLESREHNFWNLAANFLTKPAILVATFLLLVAMNITFIVESREQSISPPQADNEDQLFVSDYNLAQTAFYDQTIEQNEAVSQK